MNTTNNRRIYHEANDTYLDDAKNRRPIYNSRGLTLNANVFVDYKLKNGNGFELLLGTPFIVRDQRPDGLTRSFVASLEYQFSFNIKIVFKFENHGSNNAQCKHHLSNSGKK